MRAFSWRSVSQVVFTGWSRRVLPDVRKGSLSQIDRVCIMKQIIAHGCAFINDACTQLTTSYYRYHHITIAFLLLKASCWYYISRI